MLWLPPTTSPAAPVPLVIAGHLGLGFGTDRLVARAQAAARVGLATAAIELPGSGGRAEPDGVDAARTALRAAVAAGRPVPAEVVDGLVLPLVEQVVPEWRSALDALLTVPELREPVGVSGGNTSIGLAAAAADPRVGAVVLFAGSFLPRSIIELARTVVAPVHMLLQWDDEGNDRTQALELFDALGSPTKTLHANTGGHRGVPAFAGEEAARFLARTLGVALEGER